MNPLPPQTPYQLPVLLPIVIETSESPILEKPEPKLPTGSINYVW